MFHYPHYFKHRLSTQLRELYMTAALMDFAASAITLFEPIYLWILGYRLPEIMLFYCMVYVSYFFLLPLGGKFVAHFGPERSIMISTLWLVSYFVALISIPDAPVLLYIAPILFALQKTFYWPAYHFDFIRWSERKERGSEFSGLWTVTTMMYVLGPILGGVVVKFFGFPALFIGAAIIILCSSVPLFIQRQAPKVEPFSYWRSLLLPFRRRYRKNTVGYLGLGEELIGMTVWPIFILTVYGSVFDVGILVGISAFVTAIATLIAGKMVDQTNKKRVLSISGLLQGVFWFLRLFTRVPSAVFALDLGGRVVHNNVFVSISTQTYDRAHEDDYSWHGVYYEQGFAIAKALMALTVILVATVLDPFQASFIIAGLVSFFYLVF
jgi:MFS family permease